MTKAYVVVAHISQREHQGFGDYIPGRRYNHDHFCHCLRVRRPIFLDREKAEQLVKELEATREYEAVWILEREIQ